MRYEFRRNERVFEEPPVSGPLEGEGNFHGLSVSMTPMENLSVRAGVACFGDIANQSDAYGITPALAYQF